MGNIQGRYDLERPLARAPLEPEAMPYRLLAICMPRSRGRDRGGEEGDALGQVSRASSSFASHLAPRS